MESPQLTRVRLSESSRWWVRPATVTHIFGYPQFGTCTFSYLLAVTMSTWHATSKILALAIISTAVVPLGLLIAEAPPTPPSRDSLSSHIILWSES